MTQRNILPNNRPPRLVHRKDTPNYAIDCFNAILSQSVKAAMVDDEDCAAEPKRCVCNKAADAATDKKNECGPETLCKCGTSHDAVSSTDNSCQSENGVVNNPNHSCQCKNDAVNHKNNHCQGDGEGDMVNRQNHCCQGEHDAVNHPTHYCQGGIECIDAIDAAVTGLSGMEAVCTGHVIRYIWRWKHKNGLQDLQKARFYLNKLILLAERKSNND